MECRQAWPEPIVRVQSLSESGTEVIPHRYIRPVPERPSMDSIDQTKGMNIPVIDLGGLHGGAVDRERTIRMVSNACREWGFFQVVNHWVSLDLVQRVRQVWKDFFHLPLELKETYANNPNTYEGYGSRLGVEKGVALDWGDYFFLNLMPHSIRNMDKWPTFPAAYREVPEVIEEYGAEVLKLGEGLMRLLSKSLGLEEEFLRDECGGEEMSASLRVNYYPKCPRPDLALGLSSHSDPGALTLLLPDDHVNGLQVRKGDAWITVQAAPNSFVVNVGDQIQMLSNDIYKSVEHRVTVNSEEERMTLALFLLPAPDALGPCPGAHHRRPARLSLYPPMKYKDYRIYIRMSGPQGKSQLGSLKEGHDQTSATQY